MTVLALPDPHGSNGQLGNRNRSRERNSSDGDSAENGEASLVNIEVLFVTFITVTKALRDSV